MIIDFFYFSVFVFLFVFFSSIITPENFFNETTLRIIYVWISTWACLLVQDVCISHVEKLRMQESTEILSNHLCERKEGKNKIERKRNWKTNVRMQRSHLLSLVLFGIRPEAWSIKWELNSVVIVCSTCLLTIQDDQKKKCTERKLKYEKLWVKQ